MKKTDLDLKRLPKHIAIIMDGNGRWASRHGLSRAEGHEAGARSVRKVVEACRELKRVKSLTLYAFSTENWRRPKREVSTLFGLLTRYIELEIDNLDEQDIRVVFTGRTDGLEQHLLADMQRSMDRTKNNRSMVLNLAVNYGSRAEIVDAVRIIGDNVQAGRVRIEDIDESTISENLYMPEISELDLLIRTSGEYRLSNFMMWQASYAEIVITKVLWPDFRRRHLYNAIGEFQNRKRTFGGRQ